MLGKLMMNAILTRRLPTARFLTRTLHVTSCLGSYKTELSYQTIEPKGMRLIGQTLYERLTNIARQQPNDVAYKFTLTHVTYTYGELKQRVDELAQSYLNMGFRKGDRLAMILPNCPELVLSIMAAASIGVIVVLMNPAYQQLEIEYMLKKTQSKGVLIFDNYRILKHYDILARIAPELSTCARGELKSANLPDLKHVILVRNNVTHESKSTQYPGTWSFAEDLQKFNAPRQALPYVDLDDYIALLFTSGTTGFPKASILTHKAMLNVAYIEAHHPGCFETNRNVCIPIPIFHLFGFCIGCISSIVNGTQIVYPNFFPDTLSNIRAIEAEKCTAIKGAPVILFDLIHHPDLKKHDLSSLQQVLMGASVVPKELILNLKRALNLKHVIIGYAMTETGCTGSLTTVGDLEKSEQHAYETIGCTMPFIEAKIVDTTTNRILPRNTPGELYIRSFGNTPGYWGDPEKTAELYDSNGWLKTGDICMMDDEGYLVYKTRGKEMIIRGGVNVYPAEIENFLRKHECVLDCTVFGVPDERLGEEICAWIKRRPDTNLNEEEIIDFCKKNIARFKTPRYVKFVESFPVNATGKIQKFKMQKEMKDELGLK